MTDRERLLDELRPVAFAIAYPKPPTRSKAAGAFIRQRPPANTAKQDRVTRA